MSLLTTPLHALHCELGAKMVPFAGYDMPVQYPSGIIKEHLHTRTAAGLFDVSHMGEIRVRGPKAEDALRAIRNMLSSQAMVLRDDRHVSVSAEELVPGDIVLLQSGDKVPADLRLFRAKGLQIQEAVLTGESVAVEKGTDPVTEDAALGDRLCMAYSGTLVTHGQASGIVVATGAATEIGRISSMLRQVQVLTTPLLRQIAVFARWLTLAIGLIASSTFAYGVLVQNYAVGEMFLAAVGLAVTRAAGCRYILPVTVLRLSP